MNNQNVGPNWTKKIAGGSDNEQWKPQDMQWAPPNNPFIHGYFTDLREISGENGIFSVAEITTINVDGSIGKSFDVSGGKVLDDMLNKIDMGSYIGIKYMGKVKSRTGGRTYNSWEVYEDGTKVPFDQIPGGRTLKQSRAQASAQVNQAPQQQQQNTGNFNPPPNYNQGGNNNQFPAQNQQQGTNFQQPAQNTGNNTNLHTPQNGPGFTAPPAGWTQNNNNQTSFQPQTTGTNAPVQQQQWNPQSQVPNNQIAPNTFPTQQNAMNHSLNNETFKLHKDGVNNPNGAGSVSFGGEQVPGNIFNGNDKLPF